MKLSHSAPLFPLNSFTIGPAWLVSFCVIQYLSSGDFCHRFLPCSDCPGDDIECLKDTVVELMGCFVAQVELDKDPRQDVEASLATGGGG